MPNVDQMSEIDADESLVEDNSVSDNHISEFYPPLFFLFLASVVDIKTVIQKPTKWAEESIITLGRFEVCSK